MINIKLPENSIKYILFQRTCYFKNNLILRLLTYIGLIKPFHKLSIKLISSLYASEVETEFCKDMNEEYARIKQYLPENAKTVLDIGSGIAAIDSLISKHYDDKIDIFLIDKTKIDKNVHYFFKDKGSFYNSMDLAKSLLIMNGTVPNNIHLQEATENNEIKFNKGFDIVISLISWGFHYPVLTYLDQVYRKMNPGGVLILDIRKNTGGEKEIKKRFGHYWILSQTKTCVRILAKQ